MSFRPRKSMRTTTHSDDDAFLALADLGLPIGNDADIGRPIEADGDRPIDQEEGLLRRPDEDDNDDVPSANPGQNSNTKPTPPSRSGPTATKSRQEHIAVALGRIQGDKQYHEQHQSTTTSAPKPATAAPGAAAGKLSKLLPPHGRPKPCVSALRVQGKVLPDDFKRDVAGVIRCFREWGFVVGVQNRSRLSGVVGEFVEKGWVCFVEVTEGLQCFRQGYTCMLKPARQSSKALGLRMSNISSMLNV
jgi:hypothetical protein